MLSKSKSHLFITISVFAILIIIMRWNLYFKKNVDGAMHFIYSHKYNINSAEDSSDMN